MGKAIDKGVVKGVAKVGLRAVAAPLVLAVEGAETIYWLAQGDKMGAGICIASAAVDFVTCGVGDVIL